MKFILSFILLAGLTTSLIGQEVKEQSMTMSLGPQNSLYIEIEDTPAKVVKSEWEKYLEDDFKKVKTNRKAKEMYTENGKVALVSSKNITIYSKIDEGKGQVTLYTWTDLGDGIVSSKDYSKEAEGMQRYLSDFYVIAKKKGISIELEKEEDNMKDLNKDLSKLEKKNKDLHEDIEKYKEKIRQAEADIEQNLNDQDAKRIEIEGQQAIIEKVIERLNMVGKKS